jgi:hypothetical protein
LGHKAKWEYFQAIYGRYRKAEQGWLDTVSTTQQQLSKVEKRISDFQLTGNVMTGALRSPLRCLCDRLDRLHLRHWTGGNRRRRAAPDAGLEPLPYKL